MKKFVIVIVLLIIGVGIYWYLSSSQSGESVDYEPNNNFGSGYSGQNNNLPVNSPVMNLETSDGEFIRVANFLDDADVIEDPSNEGYFLMGGHELQGQATSYPDPAFVVEYIAETNFFAIGLLKEPLAQSRLVAEEYLMNKLNLSEEQMCSLKYSVSVSRRVNEFLAGTSFGFSFCENSFPLE